MTTILSEHSGGISNSLALSNRFVVLKMTETYSVSTLQAVKLTLTKHFSVFYTSKQETQACIHIYRTRPLWKCTENPDDSINKKHLRGSTQATIRPLAIILTVALPALVGTGGRYNTLGEYCGRSTASEVFLVLLNMLSHLEVCGYYLYFTHYTHVLAAPNISQPEEVTASGTDDSSCLLPPGVSMKAALFRYDITKAASGKQWRESSAAYHFPRHRPYHR